MVAGVGTLTTDYSHASYKLVVIVHGVHQLPMLPHTIKYFVSIHYDVFCDSTTSSSLDIAALKLCAVRSKSESPLWVFSLLRGHMKYNSVVDAVSLCSDLFSLH